MKLFDLAVASKLSGGGGSSYTLLYEEEIEVSTSSTSATTVKEITIDGTWTSSKIIVVSIRDNEGARTGYYLGSDTVFVNDSPSLGVTTSLTKLVCYQYIAKEANEGKPNVVTSTSGAGFFADRITSGGAVRLRKKYNATDTLTVNGTFHVAVYALDWPDNISPFA